METDEPLARYEGACEPTVPLSAEHSLGFTRSELDRQVSHSWTVTDDSEEDSPDTTGLELGAVINERYRLDLLLGSGGMGTVYRASDLDTGRQVALKAMLPRLALKLKARERFQREARAILRLDHPNVVKILDHGETPPHTPYLVMDFLAGASLREFMDSGKPISCERALEITRGILAGLAHAHERGVIHRDIKPENVFMVAHDDGPSRPKLLDLGLAKLVSTDSEGTPYQLTMKGAVFGTPAYMAPEQALGEELDGRADLYATTILLFELLTGQRPFYARDPPALLIMHTRRPPPPLVKLAPFLEPFESLQALVSTGLAKLPMLRFANATAYIDAIDEVLEDIAQTRAIRPRPSSVTAVSSLNESRSSLPDPNPSDAEATMNTSAMRVTRPRPVVEQQVPVGLIIGIVAALFVCGLVVALLLG